jgi:hypothetical protein
VQGGGSEDQGRRNGVGMREKGGEVNEGAARESLSPANWSKNGRSSSSPGRESDWMLSADSREKGGLREYYENKSWT